MRAPSLMGLTAGIVVCALAVSAVLLFRQDTPPELIGSIWTIWGGTILVTAINFWFGSSAGKGRNIDAEGADLPPQRQEEE